MIAFQWKILCIKSEKGYSCCETRPVCCHVGSGFNGVRYIRYGFSAIIHASHQRHNQLFPCISALIKITNKLHIVADWQNQYPHSPWPFRICFLHYPPRTLIQSFRHHRYWPAHGFSPICPALFHPEATLATWDCLHCFSSNSQSFSGSEPPSATQKRVEDICGHRLCQLPKQEWF